MTLSSPIQVLLLMIGEIITSVIKSMCTKASSKILGPINNQKNAPLDFFQHPFIQCWLVFIGEYLCLVAYLFYKLILKRSSLKDLRKFKFSILILPAFLDFFSTSLNYYGYIFVDLSLLQIFNFVVIIFCAVLSKIFLHRTLQNGQIIALIIIFLGCMLSAIFIDHKAFHVTIVGIIFLITARFLKACQFVYEEKFSVKLDLSPIFVIGMEGLIGVAIFFIALPIFQAIHVPRIEVQDCRNKFPCKAIFPYEHIEDSKVAYIQVSYNDLLIYYNLVILVLTSVFCSLGVAIAKLGSATSRTTIVIIEAIIIFILSVYIHWDNFHFMQFLSLLIASSGALLYNFYIRSDISQKKLIKV